MPQIVCPHCQGSLPLVADAFCPQCHNRLDESPLQDNPETSGGSSSRVTLAAVVVLVIAVFQFGQGHWARALSIASVGILSLLIGTIKTRR